MSRNKSTWLAGSATVLMLIAVVSALIAAQWKDEAIPLAALGLIFVLAVIKSRIVVMDFMGLRGDRRVLAAALVAWPSVFVIAAGAKALVQALAS